MTGVYAHKYKGRDLLVIGRKLTKAETAEAMKFIPVMIGDDEVVCTISRDDFAKLVGSVAEQAIISALGGDEET